MAAEAENKDNLAGQTRQHGKRVRYGEIVQLKHIFSAKYVHMNTTHRGGGRRIIKSIAALQYFFSRAHSHRQVEHYAASVMTQVFDEPTRLSQRKRTPPLHAQ